MSHSRARSTTRWAIFVVVIIISIVVVIMTADTGDKATSQNQSPQSERTVTVTTINPPNPTGELIVNGHPVPEPSATGEATLPALQLSDFTTNDPSQLEDRLRQFVQDYYGYASQDAQSLGSLECKTSAKPSNQEVSALTNKLAPYLQLLRQVRDSRLDNLSDSGVINTSEADGPPVLSELKKQVIQGNWDGVCALFNAKGFLTAEPDLGSDQARVTVRDEAATSLYFNMPIKRVLVTPTYQTLLVSDAEPVLRSEWHYIPNGQSGNWVMMSYAPER